MNICTESQRHIDKYFTNTISLLYPRELQELLLVNAMNFDKYLSKITWVLSAEGIGP